MSAPRGPGSLERCALLSRLAPGERRALEQELEAVDVDAGTLLFDEGDEAAGLVLVASGSVRLSASRTAEWTDVGPGTALGVFSLVADGPREARAETTSRSRLLLLSREGYARLAEDEPRAACRLLEGVVADTASLLRGGLDALLGSRGDATGADVDRARGSN